MAKDPVTRPMVIKKKVPQHGGHHGGAWKIAYADFVTAMMAFFLLMWLLSYTTKEQKMAIADYFNNPSQPVSMSGGHSTSMIQMGGGNDITYADGDRKTGANPKAPSEQAVRQAVHEDEKLQALKRQLEQEIELSQVLKPYKDQLTLMITRDGLRIQILDQENRPMFAIGSAVPQPYLVSMLRAIGKIVNVVPNKVSLSGYTDAHPYAGSNPHAYNNWDLSSDRAHSTRRELSGAGGMDEVKIARVVGLGSTVLLDKDNPFNPSNRRISIVVLNRAAEESIAADGAGSSPAP